MITCNLACSSSSHSHPGAYKLLSIASFNFQAKQVANTKGPCIYFGSSANYTSLGQCGAAAGESEPYPSITQQPDLCACLPLWQLEEPSGRSGPSRQGHKMPFSLDRMELIYLYVSDHISRSWLYFPKSGNDKAMFSVPVWL